ncbi:MAG: nucleotidyl transferase AbiEii/AbiGii toxin family protein [Polyangiaceae bacterium]
MIPKARILALAKAQQLQPTTVQKDYALGWLLRAISEHPFLSQWVFKGGTCLKKCFFETYRFSEDLDFTVPSGLTLSVESIGAALAEVADRIEDQCGLRFPRGDFKVEKYANPRGNHSFQAKVPFSGPVGIPRGSLQRVKFDITQDELLVDEPADREVHHGYEDATDPPPRVRCYSINEILAEKTRALIERHGRARDVYDVVHISRNFRDELNPETARAVAEKKFAFKGLPKPTVESVMEAIDEDLLKANWQHQLAHQLPILAPVETFTADLRDAIAWWLEPELAQPMLPSIPQAQGSRPPRPLFPAYSLRTPSHIEQIRYAARNRLCAVVTYNGAERLVEPYSLRHPATGNQLLHVHELEKNGRRSNQHKAFITSKITSASVSSVAFTPRWFVEL